MNSREFSNDKKIHIESMRVWTRNSVDLNKETKEEFIRRCLEKSSHTPGLENPLQENLREDENDPTPGGIRESAGDDMPPDLVSLSRHRTATIGTFNIEWLGGCPYEESNCTMRRKNSDYKKIARVIRESGACLLGLQEVVTDEALFKVIGHLKDWGFILSKNRYQKVAVIFDRNRVKYDARSLHQLDELADPEIFNYGNLRPPLSVYMKVDNFDCNFVIVHQKSGFSPDSREIRLKQSRMLNGWINEQLEKNYDKDLIVMGDFNDMLGSHSLTTISRGGILSYSTENLANDDYTSIRYQCTIDHIGYSTVEGGAAEEVQPHTTRTIDENRYPGYRHWGSDHKPLLVNVDTEFDND